VTNANLLNMTYPAFVLIFAPLIIGERTRPLHYFLLVLALAGAALILRPDLGGLATGDLLGLASGLVAGLAIPFLRQARKYDDVWTIVFWLFTVGMIINGIFLVPVFVMPQKTSVILALAGGGVLGVLGQVMLTSGYRHISAAGGSIVSSSRILFAAVLGIALFSESLTLSLVAGGVLILAALIGAARPKAARPDEARL
jgi:drug/metabolite transporter (DMT)-like permease